MNVWQKALMLSCFLAQTAYAQPALDPAFISYLVDFGDQPELFDAANQELEQQNNNQKTNSQSNTNNTRQPTKESQP